MPNATEWEYCGIPDPSAAILKGLFFNREGGFSAKCGIRGLLARYFQLRSSAAAWSRVGFTTLAYTIVDLMSLCPR